jgi:3-methyladenine DNA glycosylase AlkC
MEARKGARTLASITPELQEQLDTGLIETASLPEWLGTNQVKLSKTVLFESEFDELNLLIANSINALKLKTTTKVLPTIGSVFTEYGIKPNDRIFQRFAHHKNDMVRSWCCYIIVFQQDIDFKTALELMQPFAADLHFSVREVAWMALRPLLNQNLEAGIQSLSSCSFHENDGIRRFASEVSRPRGVWCSHIDRLKQEPELALAILFTLRNDASRYVQNSVANWLNDASKSKPEWVKTICAEWERELGDSKHTTYIIKRALRTINKTT